MPRILVVDDEATILKLVAFNLKKEGFTVDTAADGEAALDSIAKNKPDLVVLDWMLPGMDGIEVCRRIRSNPQTFDLPIVMLTARGEEVDKILGLELGANDYVTKPFSPRELTARVRAHLRAKESVYAAGEGNKGVVYRGNLSLDSERFVAKKDGIALDLSPKEFELLFLLVSNPGRVFRREYILNEIWGYEYPVDTRTVDVHIRHLRRKVETDPNNPVLLLTIRGVGYKFEEQCR